MKIVTWNCNGAFRKKYHALEKYNADIYIIQECEYPAKSADHYRDWAGNYLWLGDSKNKGLGVFVKDNIKIEKLDWQNEFKGLRVKHLLPVRVDGSFDLLAVWTHYNKSRNFNYIGQFWKYLQVNKERFKNIVIADDFNSNVCWDQDDRWWNHSDVVKELSEINITSLYHTFFNEEQGGEKQPTLYFRKDKLKPYHIDYIFTERKMTERLSTLKVGEFDDWIVLSDHMPMVAEFKK